jgi:hypothetical protein
MAGPDVLPVFAVPEVEDALVVAAGAVEVSDAEGDVAGFI